MSTLKVATFDPTSHYFLCSKCLGNQKRTHIAQRVSFVAREFRVDGEYSRNCVFKNIVNVLTDENQAADNLQHVRCVRCVAILGSKFVQSPPLFAVRRGSFYRLNMGTVCYWDGHNSLQDCQLCLLRQDKGKLIHYKIQGMKLRCRPMQNQITKVRMIWTHLGPSTLIDLQVYDAPHAPY